MASLKLTCKAAQQALYRACQSGQKNWKDNRIAMDLLDVFRKPAAIESLRGHDFTLAQSNPCQMRGEFVGRANLPVLARSAIAGPGPVAVPPVGRMVG
jgi:hypothetical protein